MVICSYVEIIECDKDSMSVELDEECEILETSDDVLLVPKDNSQNYSSAANGKKREFHGKTKNGSFTRSTGNKEKKEENSKDDQLRQPQIHSKGGQTYLPP